MLKGINADSFAIWRDALYYGDAESNGYIYKFDVGRDDNGSNIESLIHFKRHDAGSPHRQKDFNKLYLHYAGDLGYSGSIEMTYDVDDSGNSFSLGSADMDEGTGQVSAKLPFPASNVVRGRELQYFLKKNGTGNKLRLDSLVTDFTIKEPN